VKLLYWICNESDHLHKPFVFDRGDFYPQNKQQMSILLTTLHSSIWLQIITGVVVITVLISTAVPAPPRDTLWQLLSLEAIVQVVEFSFYVTAIRTAPIKDMARVRYYDWFVTTPIMLITLSAYAAYAAATANANYTHLFHLDGRKGELARFLKSEAKYIALITTANAAMLIAGLAADLGIISVPAAFFSGFAAMGLSFGIIWQRYSRHSIEGRRIFTLLSIVWSLYGVAFLANAPTRNASYNVLDVVAKNFFGLFLAYKVITSKPL
jgi:bacteriorhodopsin